MTDPEIDPARVEAAAKAYVYGYPLVYCLSEVAKLTTGASSVIAGATPFNSFGAARRLLGPEAEFVSPNNDTLYLVAPCDLSAGPLVLDVPDTADRYYVLQLVDAWTNNFGYIGRRATGTAARSFLLAPDGFAGDSGGRTVVECPTDVFVIVGRIQVDGPEDLPAVHALQDAFRLGPAPGHGAALRGLPVAADGVADELAWWEQLRSSLAACPPPPGDAAVVDVLRSLGLLDADAEADLRDPAPDLAATLVAGQEQGEALVESLSKSALAVVDGWSSALHAFDYNTDHLSLGTIDSPEWRIDDRTTAQVTRAVAARLGLWGNHGYEADYHMLWQDEHGDPLDGSRSYELTLTPPPVDAFWSLTMYDEPDYYLVDNPIDRYSIGDRTDGLRVDADGSVTIYIQADPPGPDQRSNWLPAPPGPFRPILRSYQPGPALLDGSYVFPPLRRTA